jgi:hypothetical protein
MTAEGPDREALIERLLRSRLSMGFHTDRWNDEDWQRKFWNEALDLALLPTPPAPGGHTPHLAFCAACSEVAGRYTEHTPPAPGDWTREQHDAECGNGGCPGYDYHRTRRPAPGVWHGEVRNKSMPTYGGCSCGKPWPCPDAPGDGEGLRAEVENTTAPAYRLVHPDDLRRYEAAVAALAVRDTDQGGFDTNTARNARVRIRSGDTDQGARDALAEENAALRRIIRNDTLTADDIRLRAALTRATPEADDDHFRYLKRTLGVDQ